MRVIILRGLPGSLKSTWCRQNNIPIDVICSGDHFFYDSKGNYNFDRSKLNEAHGECLKKFISLCFRAQKDKKENSIVAVVDNTNTFPLEMAPYVSIAGAYGLDIEIIRMDCSIKTSIERNQHEVPEETIIRMWQKLQKKQFPSWWPKEKVINTDD